MTRRALGFLVLLATIFFAAHAGLAATAFSEIWEASTAFKVIEIAVYGLASLLVLRRGLQDAAAEKRAAVLIIATAVVFRLMLLFAIPDSDLNRYVWDGRVQSVGINPYVYIPADPALKFLRDDDIYGSMNRVDYAPTIYPPLAQILFFVVTRVSESVVVMKAALLLCEAAAVWALMALLKGRGFPPQRILLYVWNPLPIWEFAKSGHIDAAALCCIMLALLAAERKRPFLAGIALGGATLVKFMPIVVAPALYRRWDWRAPLAGVATVVVLYLPYLGAGKAIFGFLGGYSDEEGFRDGSGLYPWLLMKHLLPLPERAFEIYFPFAALALGAAGLRVLLARKRHGADLAGAFLIAETFVALTSPHYAWYFAWLVPFLCFVPSLAVMYLTCAATLMDMYDWPPSFGGGSVLFLPFLGLLGLDIVNYFRGKSESQGLAVEPDGINATVSTSSS